MIETERLVLKPFSYEDERVLSELFCDSDVKKTYLLPDFKDEDHLSKYFKRICEMSNSGKYYLFGIYLKENGELLGIINDTERNEFESVEIGYALLPRYHNKGYATEAFCALIQYLKGLGYKRVEAGAFEENLASIRVMEKCGMTKMGRTENLQYRGKEHTVVYYSV